MINLYFLLYFFFYAHSKMVSPSGYSICNVVDLKPASGGSRSSFSEFFFCCFLGLFLVLQFLLFFWFLVKQKSFSVVQTQGVMITPEYFLRYA